MLNSDAYYTIDNVTESVYKSKGSSFYTFCYPVDSEEKVRAKLNDLKRKYPDASHHCYAYVLQYEKSITRANDDGEPSNTAGKPILRQILKNGLTNTLVVVVRYFGGTLLGVPGLIKAYEQAAMDGLNSCRIIRFLVYEKFEISCPFGQEKDIYKLCKQFHINLSVKLSHECFYAEIKIPLQQTEAFKQQIKAYYQIVIKYTGIE